MPWTIVRDWATAQSVGPLHNAGFKKKEFWKILAWSVSSRGLVVVVSGRHAHDMHSRNTGAIHINKVIVMMRLMMIMMQ